MKKAVIVVSVLLLIFVGFLIFTNYFKPEILPAPGNTYYISTSGNDAWTGLCQAYDGGSCGPWKSLSKINTLPLQPGDSALLRRGDTWTLSETFGIGVLGTSSSPITIGSYTDGSINKPVIRSDRSYIGPVVQVNWQKHDLVIKDIVFRDARTNSYDGQGLVLNENYNILIDNSEFINNDYSGFTLYGKTGACNSITPANVEVRNSIAHDNGAQGFDASGTTPSLTCYYQIGNVIFDNDVSYNNYATAEGAWADGYGFKFTFVDNSKIINSEAYGNDLVGINLDGSRGGAGGGEDVLPIGSNNNEIAYNHAYDNRNDFGIALEVSSNNLIHHNDLHGNGVDDGWQGQLSLEWISQNNKVYYNKMYGGNSGNPELQILEQSTGNEIYNNVIIGSGAMLQGRAVELKIDGTIFKNNILIGYVETNGHNYIDDYNIWTTSGLLLTPDYHIQSGSTAIDAGVSVTIPPPIVDIDGDSVPQPVGGLVDIGADEYVSSPPETCDGTDISCGIFPSCINCNLNDGCNGDFYRNYYCVSNSAGCSYTSDNCNDCSCTCGGYNLAETTANGNCVDGKDNDCNSCIDSVDSRCGGIETSCSDSSDNDCDGLIDCADTIDCSTDPVCQVSDLISYYPFDSDVLDHVGTNDGTFFGGAPSYVSGRKGNALIFDGVNDYVDIPDNILSGTMDFSLSTWFKTSSTGRPEIMAKRNGGIQGEFELRLDYGQIIFYVYQTSYQFQLQTSQLYNDGNWHHLVAIRDGTNGYLYVDGAQVDSDSGTIQSLDPSLDLTIGTDRRSNRFFSGQLDEVKIWNKALNSQEISDEFCYEEDFDCFGCVDAGEITNYINRWLGGDVTITQIEATSAVDRWVQGISSC